MSISGVTFIYPPPDLRLECQQNRDGATAVLSMALWLLCKGWFSLCACDCLDKSPAEPSVSCRRPG